MIIRLVAASLVILLAACSSAEPIDAVRFQKLWVQVENDSAVSWWYQGEDGESYYLIQQYPFHHNRFHVSKEGVALRGVTPNQHGSLSRPLNLKRDNVVFTEDAP